MLIAQDLAWFASYANCTGLNLVLPRMLIAQDLMWFRLVCWSHKTSCSPHMLIAPDLIVSARMLIAQDLLLLRLSGLIVDCQFGWDLKFFEDFDSMEFILFLPEGLSEAFIRCGTLLHSAFISQIEKHVSDAVCRVMYDYAWMKCSRIGFHFMFFSLHQICHFLACAYFAGLLV